MREASSNNTAILIFARTSDEEIRNKKIFNGGILFERLTDHTIETAQKTGLPFFHINEAQQKGASFGARFTNAIQYVFDQGFENIITVGNDSPHLNRAHFETALSNLRDNKSVLGPSADGGFYLMGLHRSNFKQSEFEKLSWQTSELKDEVVKLLSCSSQEAFLLPTLFDIDSFWDVKMMGNYASGLGQKVLTAIRSLISSSKKIEISSLFFIDAFQNRIPFNKGSPIHSFS